MESPKIPDDPLSKFSLSVFDVNALLMRSGEIVTSPLGQSSARWQVLGRAGYQPQTVSDMARGIGNSRQSVQRIADALFKEHLITYQDNPANKRAKLVAITPKGAAVLAAIYARNQAWSEELMHKLSGKQLTELTKALDTVGEILKKHIRAATKEKS